MKIAYLFLNGELKGNEDFFLDFIEKEKGDIFCADGGANFSYRLNLIPKEIWGDLDSIKTEVKNFYEDKKVVFKRFKVEKNNTDAELILDELKNKYDKIYCLAGLGGDLDHELTNLNLLEKYPNLFFLTEQEKIFKIENYHMFKDSKNKKISFIIFSDEIKNLSLKGFKYDVENLDLKKGDTRCISNIINQDFAEIYIKKGKLLCIEKN